MTMTEEERQALFERYADLLGPDPMPVARTEDEIWEVFHNGGDIMGTRELMEEMGPGYFETPEDFVDACEGAITEEELMEIEHERERRNAGTQT